MRAAGAGRSAADFARELEGKQYYVKWSFRRIGRVSTDDWRGEWETPKVTLARTPADGEIVREDFFRR